MHFRSARYTAADQSAVTMELQHPSRGWMPITINAAEYPELWAEVVATDVAPFAAPDLAAWRARAFLSRRDFCLAMHRLQILDFPAALAAAKGEWPALFASMLDGMPEDISPEQAQISWAAAQTVDRLDPLFEAVRVAFGMTPEQADAMFGHVGA